MTQWVENPSGGRARGPRGLARAWVEVLVRPRRFFRTGVAPGDQAPGLTFAMAVVAIEESTRFLLVANALPDITGERASSFAVAVSVAVLLVTPAALHLVSGLQTLLLMLLTTDRGGVSETVQVTGYAIAPCVFAGPAISGLRIACCVYGTLLFVLGMAEVHDLSLRRATLVGTIPVAVVFGYAFRGFAAVADLLAQSGFDPSSVV